MKEKSSPAVKLLEDKAKLHREAAAGYRRDAAEQNRHAAEFQAETIQYRAAVELLKALPKAKEGDPLLRRGPLFMMESGAENGKTCMDQCLSAAAAKGEASNEQWLLQRRSRHE